MGMFMVRGISPWRCLSFITRPSCPAEAIPVLATFTTAVADEAQIVVSSVTPRTVVMKVILHVLFATAVAGYGRLGVSLRRTLDCDLTSRQRVESMARSFCLGIP
jgi:hypothetical protein